MFCCRNRFPQFDCRYSFVDLRSAPQRVGASLAKEEGRHPRDLCQRAFVRRRALLRAMGLPLRPLLWRELVSHPALPEPHRPPTRVVLATILKYLRLFEALLRRDVVATLDISK